VTRSRRVFLDTPRSNGGLLLRMAKGKTLTRAELARQHGVALTTVDQWVKRGCPAEPPPKGGRGNRFNSRAVIEWRIAEAAPEEAPAPLISFEEARTEKMIAEAELARLEVGKRRGELVEVAIVSELVERDYSTVRSKILGVATKVAPRVVATRDATRAQAIIDAEVREVLDELADGVGFAARASEQAREKGGGGGSRESSSSSA